MKIDNTIEKLLSDPAIVAGYTILLSGFFVPLANNFSFKSLIFGIPAILFASFACFTYKGVEIDTDSKRIKQYYKLLSLIKTGKWEDLNTYIGVTMTPVKRIYRVASMSNSRYSTEKKDFRIYLVNKAKKPVLLIKICDNMEDAINSLDEFSIWLKIPVFSRK